MADLSFIQNEFRVLKIRGNFEKKDEASFIAELIKIFRSSSNEIVSEVFEKVSREDLSFGVQYSHFKKFLDPILHTEREREKTNRILRGKEINEPKPAKEDFDNIRKKLAMLKAKTQSLDTTYLNVNKHMQKALKEGDRARAAKAQIKSIIKSRREREKNGTFVAKCPCGMDLPVNDCFCNEYEYLRQQ